MTRHVSVNVVFNTSVVVCYSNTNHVAKFGKANLMLYILRAIQIATHILIPTKWSKTLFIYIATTL